MHIKEITSWKRAYGLVDRLQLQVPGATVRPPGRVFVLAYKSRLRAYIYKLGLKFELGGGLGLKFEPGLKF